MYSKLAANLSCFLLPGTANVPRLAAVGLASCAALALPVQALQLQQGFAGAYDPGNWALVSDSALGDGSVNLATAPTSIVLTGSNSGDLTGYFAGVNTDYTATAVATGPVSFDWSFFSHRVHSPDGFGFLLNGLFTQLADQSSLGSGFSQFNVLAGDVFGFRAFTLDNSVGPGVATISNFSAPVAGPAPAPGPLPLLGVGVAFGCCRRLRRRTGMAEGRVSTAMESTDQH
jgi:hypothetical protein